ncbi:MAG TPA: hypothetical protein DEO59_17050 [Balneola sp.]|nr:hypothetical protein [Balneola sp.]
MGATTKSIEETLARSVCQGWDREFLTSILGKLEDSSVLSQRQKITLHQVLARATVEEESKHLKWSPEFRHKYQEAALVLAHYHIKQRYFDDIASIILGGGVPLRRKYMRMHNNKYSQKIMREFDREPRIALGTHVLPRSGFNKFKHVETSFLGDYEEERRSVERFIKDGAFIVGVEKYVISAARGAKRYRLLSPGSRHVFLVEERFLKRV